jgi:hypothetical protein
LPPHLAFKKQVFKKILPQSPPHLCYESKR